MSQIFSVDVRMANVQVRNIRPKLYDSITSAANGYSVRREIKKMI